MRRTDQVRLSLLIKEKSIMEKYQKILTGSIAVSMAVLLYILTFSVKSFGSIGVGPEFVPRIVAVILFGFGTFLIFQWFLEKKIVSDPAEKVEKEPFRVRPFLLTLLLLCLYVALLRTVGFIIMSCVYLFFQMNILAPEGHRKPIVFALVSVLTSLAAYYLFVGFFHIMIPAGILG